MGKLAAANISGANACARLRIQTVPALAADQAAIQAARAELAHICATDAPSAVRQCGAPVLPAIVARMFLRHANAASASNSGSHFSMASSVICSRPLSMASNRDGVDDVEDVGCDTLGDL